MPRPSIDAGPPQPDILVTLRPPDTRPVPSHGTPTPAETESRPGLLGFMLRMGFFVVLGTPLVGYIWGTIHEVLALHVSPLRLALTVLAIVLLLGLVAWMHRSVRRWLGETG